MKIETLPARRFKTKMPTYVLQCLLDTTAGPPLVMDADGSVVEMTILHVDLVEGCMHWVPLDMTQWEDLSNHFTQYQPEDTAHYD